MARFTYPYEIIKLYAIKEKEPDKVDTEISYAFAVQENFDTIKKYLNEIIDADNIVDNSITNIEIKTNTITGGADGNLALTTIIGDNIANYTITGTQLATDSITLANLGTTWTNWTPTYTVSTGMTFTSITTDIAKYFKIDKVVFFLIYFYGTTGGSAGSYLKFTLPIAPADSGIGKLGGGCWISDGTDLSGMWYNGTNSKILVGRYDQANWGLGANRGAKVQGFYRIA